MTRAAAPSAGTWGASMWLVPIAILAAAVLAVAWAGRASEGRRALAEANAAVARGDTSEALLAARIAAESRCPGCTAPDAGFATLERLARDAEARGDDATAFAAWRATRAALLATSVISSDSARRTHAESEIARFAHRLDAAAVATGSSATPAATEERVRAALAANDLPRGTTFAVVGLGGLVFLGAATRFALARGSRRPAELGLAAGGAALAAAGALFF